MNGKEQESPLRRVDQTSNIFQVVDRDSSQSQSVILILSISGQLRLSSSQKHVESSNSGIRRCLSRNGLPLKCFGRLKSSEELVTTLILYLKKYFMVFCFE